VIVDIVIVGVGVGVGVGVCGGCESFCRRRDFLVDSLCRWNGNGLHEQLVSDLSIFFLEPRRVAGVVRIHGHQVEQQADRKVRMNVVGSDHGCC